ncbi:MAG: class II aldolase/adducin family protein [Chloroflexi bacterium]|nr:class II aldolase/adducin family protein [Chloroflexota bacterium]
MNDSLELREKLARAYRILALEGQTDFHLGHITAREPGTSTFWMKRSDIGMEEVTAQDLLLLDFDGNIIRGDGRRHYEYPLHAEIYRRRADVQAVTHTHPEHCIALGAGDEPFHPVSNEGNFFEPHVPTFTEFTDLILTRAQGEKTTDALGDARALLLRNHGIIVAGASIEEACLGALLLERGARIQLLAAMQTRYQWTSAAEAKIKREHVYGGRMIQTIWEYECRKLERAKY